MPKETTLFEREVPEATLLWKYASEQRGHYNTQTWHPKAKRQIGNMMKNYAIGDFFLDFLALGFQNE